MSRISCQIPFQLSQIFFKWNAFYSLLWNMDIQGNMCKTFFPKYPNVISDLVKSNCFSEKSFVYWGQLQERFFLTLIKLNKDPQIFLNFFVCYFKKLYINYNLVRSGVCPSLDILITLHLSYQIWYFPLWLFSLIWFSHMEWLKNKLTSDRLTLQNMALLLWRSLVNQLSM